MAAIFTGRLLYVPPLLFALFAIQASSTRSFLGGIGALYAAMHIYALAGRERRKLIGMAVFDGVLVAMLLYLYSRGYFDNWVARFVQNETAGGDATLLTRLAENYPGMQPQLDRGVSVSIDGRIFNDSWFQPIKPDSEVVLLPRIVGG